MGMRERIEEKLRAAFAPQSLSVADDSAKHAGHAGARPGGQTHFTVTLVSERFVGKTLVARHRMVYDALKTELEERVHALAIIAKTPEEAGAAA